MRRSVLSARSWVGLASHTAAPESSFGVAALAPTGALIQRRGIKLFEIFSKEKSAERRAKLKTELQKGYFDDFKQLRDTDGRVFEPDANLSLASTATSIPELNVTLSDGSVATFPSMLESFSGGLLCVGIRQGADTMLQPWCEAFAKEFAGHDTLRWFQLSLVESKVLGVWPFSSWLVRAGASQQGKASQSLQPTNLFHFGVAEEFKQALDITNQLTGYVYLIDGTGKVRWRACGTPSHADITLLLQHARTLFNSPTFQGHS